MLDVCTALVTANQYQRDADEGLARFRARSLGIGMLAEGC